MAVLVVASNQLILCRPSLLNQNNIFIEALAKLVFNHNLVLVSTRSQDESFVPKLFLMPISNELNFEIAGVVLSLILMHSLVNVSFCFQGLLYTFKVIIPLVELLDLLI